MNVNATIESMMQNLGIQYNAASHVKFLIENYQTNHISKLEFYTRLDKCAEKHRMLGSKWKDDKAAIHNLILAVKNEHFK